MGKGESHVHVAPEFPLGPGCNNFIWIWFVLLMARSILPPWAVLGGFLELEGRAGQGIPRQWPGGWGVHWPCCHCVARSCCGEEGGGACTCLEEKVPGGQERERRETEEIIVLHVGHWLYIHKILEYTTETHCRPRTTCQVTVWILITAITASAG